MLETCQRYEMCPERQRNCIRIISAGVINQQIATCSSPQFVLLGPGTFHLTGSINLASKNYFVLRGSGANATFLSFSNVDEDDGNLGTAARLTGQMR